MKIKKDGTVKLEKEEIRVGNFFVRREENHMKLTDLNGVFSFRASRMIPVGIWLENIWARAVNGEEVALSTLKTYIATMWSVFSVAPDDDYIGGLLEVAQDALGRHPDWYGIKKEATDEEDAEVLQEVKEMKEFEDDLRKLAEREDGGQG